MRANRKTIIGLTIAVAVLVAAVATILSAKQESSPRYLSKHFEGVVISCQADPEGIILALDCAGYLSPRFVLVTDKTLLSESMPPITEEGVIGVRIKVYSEYWTQDLGNRAPEYTLLYPATIVVLVT